MVEKIDLKNERISDHESLVTLTLTLDQVT